MSLHRPPRSQNPTTPQSAVYGVDDAAVEVAHGCEQHGLDLDVCRLGCSEGPHSNRWVRGPLAPVLHSRKNVFHTVYVHPGRPSHGERVVVPTSSFVLAETDVVLEVVHLVHAHIPREPHMDLV